MLCLIVKNTNCTQTSPRGRPVILQESDDESDCDDPPLPALELLGPVHSDHQQGLEGLSGCRQSVDQCVGGGGDGGQMVTSSDLLAIKGEGFVCQTVR